MRITKEEVRNIVAKILSNNNYYDRTNVFMDS